ncbi:arylesterase [Nonlabens antarcticus]|uniref:arylesterase n=1 Tax=Nonlabens antarcticus TaxID=392714 RepID=UPI0018916B40|nr:arylesterase [Nonlabens antarcticus]
MQTLLNRGISNQRNLLNFCYFIVAISLICCGKESKADANQNTPTATTSENDSDTITPKKTILFFGDSITAGYGLDDTNDAFPGLIQTKIDSLGLDYEIINSGLSGETSAGGKSRIDWILNQEIDIFVLELGANDGLRGVPLSETRLNLQAIIDAVNAKSPDTQIIIAGMQLPPNMGQEYTTEFKSIFSDLAAENDLAFIPFILKDVGGIAALNQSDGIHPTAEGHRIVANNVWEILSVVMD